MQAFGRFVFVASHLPTESHTHKITPRVFLDMSRDNREPCGIWVASRRWTDSREAHFFRALRHRTVSAFGASENYSRCHAQPHSCSKPRTCRAVDTSQFEKDPSNSGITTNLDDIPQVRSFYGKRRFPLPFVVVCVVFVSSFRFVAFLRLRCSASYGDGFLTVSDTTDHRLDTLGPHPRGPQGNNHCG